MRSVVRASGRDYSGLDPGSASPPRSASPAPPRARPLCGRLLKDCFRLLSTHHKPLFPFGGPLAGGGTFEGALLSGISPVGMGRDGVMEIVGPVMVYLTVLFVTCSPGGSAFGPSPVSKAARLGGPYPRA